MGGRTRLEYSEVFYWMVDHLYDNYMDTMTDISRWSNYAQVFADSTYAISKKAPRCIGFIDGTFRSHCRPSVDQGSCYNGHEKDHGIKFQSVILPNGLIGDFWGPCVGRRGDGYMFRRSDLLTRMARLCNRAGSIYYLWGDPAYPLSRYVLRGYKGAMSPAEQELSTAMSAVPSVRLPAPPGHPHKMSPIS